MTTYYKAIFPLIGDMPSAWYVVGDTKKMSKEEEALWYYNRDRLHYKLPLLDALPDGVNFERIRA